MGEVGNREVRGRRGKVVHRHEALHDDVTEHERTKQAKFEQEMEVLWGMECCIQRRGVQVTWEKGGPGLVWEMDKAKWDEMEKVRWARNSCCE